MSRSFARPQLLCVPLIGLFGALLVWPLALLGWESIAEHGQPDSA